MTLGPFMWQTADAASRGLVEIQYRMSGGENFDVYLEKLRGNGQAQCTTVWTKTTIAYRCRTCQVNDSSAICISCFQAGDHRHHDYVMYHSDSGGCCDCGDPAAWKEEGFCANHSSYQPHKEPTIASHLKEVTSEAVHFVLKELSLWVEMIVEAKHLDRVSPVFLHELKMAEIYVIWLQKVSTVSVLRTVITEEMVRGRPLKDELVHNPNCFLDTLLSTYARMPECLMEAETTLFLQMLYDHEFKDTFSRALMRHYAAMILPAAVAPGLLADYKILDRSFDRVMVQLFNVPEITLSLIQTDHLLECVMGVFASIVNHCTDKDAGTVIVDHPAIRGKVYGRPQGDLKLIVAHDMVALHVLGKRPDVFQTILSIWSMLQWMNPYTQSETWDFEEHVSWTLAITLEMSSMGIAFGLVGRCFSAFPGSEDCARRALVSAACLTMTSLRQFFSKCNVAEGSEDTVSLHIPLHRTLCAVISKLVLMPWNNSSDGFLTQLQPAFTESEVLALMDHPLRVTVWMAQIRAQMWRNSSEDFSRLELIYRGSIWHAQSMDMDILMLQFCSVARENMEQSIFLAMAQKFNLLDMVTMPTAVGDIVKFFSRTTLSMLHDFLRLILLIVRERRNTGLSEEQSLRSDVIQWLCVRDQTYSQLAFSLSGILIEQSKLSCVLDEVAIYNVPKLQERGFYQLKAECWKEFDPLFSHFYLNDLEEAQERAMSVGKLLHYWRLPPPKEAKPPFNRLLKLLHTQACHQLIWNVLHCVTTLIGDEFSATSAEALGVMALQLLGMALTDIRGRALSQHMSTGVPPSVDMKSKPIQPSKDISVFIHAKPYITAGTVDWDHPDSTYPSIHEMLHYLFHVKDSLRLADSVEHVLNILSSYSDTKSTSESSIFQDSDACREEERRKMKKQRQEAIIADFAARQKAFLEQALCEDLKDREEAALPASECDGEFHREPLVRPGLTHSQGTMSSETAGCETMEHECAFCRSECDGLESPSGWIALVQRYNLPGLIHNCGKVSTTTKEVRSIVFGSEYREGIQFPDMITVVAGSPNNTVSRSGCLDVHPTRHIRCCGHQMHQMCFQRYADSLLKRHYARSPYEGKGIIDLGKLDFLCPICRRLANVLLPDVNKVSPWKTFWNKQEQDKQGMLLREYDQIETELPFLNLESLLPCGSSELHDMEYWRDYWQSHQDIAEAIGMFATQCLRVRKTFLREPPDLDGLLLCQILWETLAENIIHCEVETREEGGTSEEVASSSYASGTSEDIVFWRSDAAHWRALIQLGKLAMLTNTMPCAGKKEKRLLLLQCIGLEGGAMQKVMDNTPKTFGKSDESDKLLIRSDAYRRECKQTKCVESLPTLDSVGMDILNPNDTKGIFLTQDSKGPLGEGRGDVKAMERTKALKILAAGSKAGRSNLHPEEEEPQLLEEGKSTEIGWSWNNTDFSDSEALVSGDPFELLVMFFITVEGWPSFQEIMTMVRVAYVLAAAQASIAFDKLSIQEGEDALLLSTLKDRLLQVACLPFLRRVALLVCRPSFVQSRCTLQVQLVTQRKFQEKKGEEFRLMDSSHLQLWLNLPNIQEAVKLGMQGILGSKLQHDWQNSQHAPLLYRSPRQALLTPLPDIFQELVLKNLKRSCLNCHRVPREPAICLVCGNLLCCGTECCNIGGLGECYRHADKESAGVGLFLLMRSTQLVLLRSNRVCMAPSLYLDLHGEEDAFLKRGHPLHLSHLRLNEIRRLWVTASFDHETYILHTSQIGGEVL